MKKSISLDTKGLTELQKEIEKMQQKMEEAAKKLAKELSEYGLEQMEDIYSNFELHGSQPSTFYIEGTENNKKIVMQGPQAIYDEFGTGTEGAMKPHPIKKEFNLDDYNSHIIPNGTIRYATQKDVNKARAKGEYIPLGGLFWTYKDEAGETHYTQGTPAQREGYDSLMATIDKSPEIIHKVMKEVVKDD